MQKCYTYYSSVLRKELGQESTLAKAFHFSNLLQFFCPSCYTPCPPHHPLIFVLQLKVALFCDEARKKALWGCLFFFLLMHCNFNFRLVGSEAHIWKYGGLPFFSAFKYYDCTAEVINIPELIQTHIHKIKVLLSVTSAYPVYFYQIHLSLLAHSHDLDTETIADCHMNSHKLLKCILYHTESLMSSQWKSRTNSNISSCGEVEKLDILP